MTNTEKYKSAKERDRAFCKFCGEHDCRTCPLQQSESLSCRFAWLDLEAEEEPMNASEAADMLAKYVTWRKNCHILTRPYTWEEANTAIDRAIELLRNIKE